ncbi:MAG: gliding motility-associated C-terminal domain-containing protein [Brumimicrobium sp.]|nr:gliding motility-associated C-terminal domain-containing protein [Brumimicrobium sp.]
MTFRYLIFCLFSSLIFHVTWAQESYNNCANAIELCPGKKFTLNNINANATVCSNCEDDFTFCFSGKNTIWATFKTNDLGGTVNVNFSNLVFQNLPGQGNELQAAFIEATLPCISSSYTLISNCQANGTGNFSITATALPPNTTYYLVINGSFGTSKYAEATFDVLVNGPGANRNPWFGISSSSATLCKGNAITVYSKALGCDEQSVTEWYVNGSHMGTTIDTFYMFNYLQNGDVVSAKTSCFNQCRDTVYSNTLTFTVLDFLVDAGEDKYIKEGESVILNGQTTGTNVVWTPNYEISDPNTITPIVSPSTTTTYFLTADNGICSITDEVTVFVESGLEIPNTFSPNGDGINETWEILGIEQYPDCSIQVYTRWGQLVFQTTGYTVEKRWDGTSKSGNKLASGAYFYVINLRDKQFDKPLKGTVTIVR